MVGLGVGLDVGIEVGAAEGLLECILVGLEVGAAEVGLADGTLDFSLVGIFDCKREGFMVGVLVVGEELGSVDRFPVVGLGLVGGGLGDRVGIAMVGELDGLEVAG